MAYNQGGIQDIKDLSGVQYMNIGALDQSTMPDSFGYIKRANFGKGSEIAGNRAFNAGELFMDNNAVGLNNIKKFIKPTTSSKVFIA